jgi:3-phenylpropionate/trans-cinnamate dioxygenase ferredoxin subunit
MTTTANWIEVAHVGDIPAGELRSFAVNGAMVVVFNLHGEYYALDDVCTHDGGPLSDGVVQGDNVACPRHGACFNIRTGAVTAPPAVEPVRAFPVRVRDGVVEILDERGD